MKKCRERKRKKSGVKKGKPLKEKTTTTVEPETMQLTPGSPIQRPRASYIMALILHMHV